MNCVSTTHDIYPYTHNLYPFGFAHSLSLGSFNVRQTFLVVYTRATPAIYAVMSGNKSLSQDRMAHGIVTGHKVSSSGSNPIGSAR